MVSEQPELLKKVFKLADSLYQSGGQSEINIARNMSSVNEMDVLHTILDREMESYNVYDYPKELEKERKKTSRTPEKEAEIEAYKAKGLDEDVASAIVDPDESVDLGIKDLPIENLEREDRLTSTWKNLKEETVEDYVSQTKSTINPEIQEAWSKAIDQMHGVIHAS